MAGTRGNKLLFPTIFIDDRTACGNGQMGGHILHQNFLLATKATANPGLDDTDAFYRQSQDRGQLPANMEGNLGAGADYQTVVFVPICDGNMRFDMSLLHFGNGVFGFEDLICFGEAFFQVTDINTDRSRQVFLRFGIGKVDILRFVVDARGSGLHGNGRVENRRKHFIIHIDQAKSLFGNPRRFSGNEGNPVAYKADFVIQRKSIQRARDRVRLPGSGINDARDILPGENSSHSG